MPTIALENSIFLHTPKTGGVAVSLWLDKNKLSRFNYLTDLDQGPIDQRQHCALKNLLPQHASLPKFAFVRHPMQWYKSLWQYKLRNTDAAKPIDKAAEQGLDAFMDEMVIANEKSGAGCASWTFKKWIGEGDSRIEFVGRNEELFRGVYQAMDLFGETVIDTSPVVSNASKPIVAKFSQKHIDWINKVDRDILEEFYSWPAH